MPATMPAKRDYYEVLGVAKSASADEIKRAYRKAAAAHHPDRNPGDAEAVDRFKEAAEAYDVLSNDDKRQLYDRLGHEAFSRGGGGRGPTAGFQDLEEIFGAFGGVFEGLFGGAQRGGGGRGGPRASKGDSLRCRIQLELKEAAFGCSKTVEVDRDELCEDCKGSGAKAGSSPVKCDYCGGRGQVIQQQAFFRIQTTCPACKGAGEVVREKCGSCSGSGRKSKRARLDVRVPAGVEDGMQLCLRGEGDPGDRGGPRGDLYCELHIKPHPLFERDGSNLHCTVPISFTQAALGTSFEIPLLDGKHLLEIPPGTQPGDVLKIARQGMPHYQTQRKGDVLVEVQVEIPRKLGPRQEELIRELAELEHKN
ncbi:MAG: molecular chaperone DnaJ, partial [Planctomycetota bacterium]|nr:molecular chaperone DnaJ [Planctomycetota bacterium]